MITNIKEIEAAASELKLSFSKENKVSIFTSEGKQQIFDVFQFNNGEFFICIFNDGFKFALGGSHDVMQLCNLFCPTHKTSESDIYSCIIDTCKSLMKRDNLITLYIEQGNMLMGKNKLGSLSVYELTAFFNTAAFHGQLDICKLIYEKANFMHASHAMVFACQEGKLDTAKWLYSVGGDPHFKDCKCLKHTLYSIKKDKYKMINYDIVDWLCRIIHPHSLKKYLIPNRPILN